ncbi:MAG: hypothetical protein IKI21_01275 [Oscillospiraceae bacterium]|nr:hypothetical protein [Oscillospiraceae bacterium]
MTYSLNASSRVQKNAETDEVIPYQLMYEDGAPSIVNRDGIDGDERVLGPKEYDFQRVLVKKLVDGNTVGVIDHLDEDGKPVYKPETGFNFVIYGKSNDPDAPDLGVWRELGTGNTEKDTEIGLPSGIDEIRLVVKDLYIRADLTAYVDVAYQLDMADHDHVYVDTEHTSDTTASGGKVVHETTNKGTRLKNTFTRSQYLGAETVFTDDTVPNALEVTSGHSNSWLREATTTLEAFATIEGFQFHDGSAALTPEEIAQAGGVTPRDYYSTVITARGTIQADTGSSLTKFRLYSKVPDGVTPSSDWLDQFRSSLKMSGMLLGSDEVIDETYVLEHDAVSVYYDEEMGCICADFDMTGSALRADALTDISFSYPAEISLAKVKNGYDQLPFVTETCLSVMDPNVKVSVGQYSVPVEAFQSPTGATAAMKADDTSITARGSQRNNYTKKEVASYYNGWIYDKDTEVDGSNTHHLQGSKMTSEYTYKLEFFRISTDAETVRDPLLIDIVEGLDASAWHGYVKKIWFDAASYPRGEEDGYAPEVYYLLRDSAEVTASPEDATGSRGDYRNTYAPVMDLIDEYQQYGEGVDEEADYGEAISSYETLRDAIASGADGWQMATENADGSWTIDHGDVFAVAVLFRGEHQIVSDMSLGAYLDMSAPPLENDSDIEKIINNRATYNEAHVFAESTTAYDGEFPLYSVSNRTLVVLRHNVSLEKVSSKDHSRRLTGACFTIFQDDSSFENVSTNSNIVRYYTFDKKRNRNETKKMFNMPVDLTGVLQLNLSPGIYYYVETKPPRGYLPDPAPYRFRVTADTDSVYYYTVKLHDDAAALAAEHFIINEEEFTQYRDTVYQNKTAAVDDLYVYAVTPDQMTRVEWFTDGIDENEGKYVYAVDALAVEQHALVQSTDGRVVLKNLPAGTYFIGASEADPDGYYFSVADNSEIAFRVIRKSPMSTGVRYAVYESVGSGNSADDRPCRFKLEDNVYTLDFSADVTSVAPLANGTLPIAGLDPTKNYYLVLEEAPTGYKTSTASAYDIEDTDHVTLYAAEALLKQQRLIVEDDPILAARAMFCKIDGTDSNFYGTQINGAKYNMYVLEEDGSESKLYFEYLPDKKIYHCVGTSAGEGLTGDLISATDENGVIGMIEVTNLTFGTYYLQEIEAPVGYQLNTEKQFFRVAPSTIDEKGQLLFTLDERYMAFLEGDPSTEPTEPTEATTEAPTEPGASGEESGEDDKKKYSDTMLLKDEEILSDIVLNKNEELDPEQYLKNGRYDLYRLMPGMQPGEGLAASVQSKGNTESDEFQAYWTLVATADTDATGEAVFHGLPFGTYLLYERQPPIGYKWNNDLSKWETWTVKDPQHRRNDQLIVLSEDTIARNSDLITSTVTGEDGSETFETSRRYYAFYASHADERKEGQARLIKRNADGLGLLDGVFALYRVNVTDQELAGILGKTDAEIAAMTESEKQRALVKHTPSVSDIDMDLHFDSAAGRPRAASASSDQTLDTPIDVELRTNADPSTRGATKTVSGLPWGVYYYYEVKAPSGYRADPTPHVFAVDADTVGTLIEIEAEDDKTYGKVWLYKQAKDAEENGGHLRMFGAQFELYDKKDDPVWSLPRLQLGGTVPSGSMTKEFLVKHCTVDPEVENRITFQIVEGDDLNDTYDITIEYDKNTDGTVRSVTGDSHFEERYHATLDPGKMRLTYYVADPTKTMLFDYDTGRYLPIRPVLPEDATPEQTAAADRRAAAIQACLTKTYVTADEGGQILIRGLDWDQYHFHETVPPIGYGRADDVVFTVNAYNSGNQFIRCDDPKAQAAIIIDKEIPDADYFKAYGEPTFQFRISELREDADAAAPAYTKDGVKYVKTGRTYTLSIHLRDPNTFESDMVNVDMGQYLIEELPVSRYRCCGLELIEDPNGAPVKVKSADLTTPTSTVILANDRYEINDGDAGQPWTAFCDLTGADSQFGEMLAFHVKYENKIARYDHFSEVTYADNRIPEREYLTSFKPVYDPLVPVYGGTDNTYPYTVDLKTALGAETFEAVLGYNTGRIERLEDLTHVRFSSVNEIDKIQSIVFDPATGILRLTVTDPATFAGSTIMLDVGYSEKDSFDAYDEGDPNMVKGTLALTFGELRATQQKKLTLKNDVSNKSYFPYADPENKVQDVTSVAMFYQKTIADDDTVTYSYTMQDPANTDTLKTTTGYLLYWYMLDPDGRPVLDNERDPIRFTREEIVDYMFDGIWPAYLTADGADLLTGAKLADGTTLVSSLGGSAVDSINSFTFQAEVVSRRPLTACVKLTTKELLNESGILGRKNPGYVSGEITGVSAANMTAFKEGSEEGWELCDDRHRLTYDSHAGHYADGDPYPDLVRFYAIGTEIYWYTVDRTTLKPTEGSVFLEQNENNYNNTANLFRGYTKLNDVSGIFDWDFSGVNMCGRMFQNTAITTFTLDRTYKKEGLMYMNRMFIDCKKLRSVKMDIDTTLAGDGSEEGPEKTYVSAQTKLMFSGCSMLQELDLTGDFSNLWNDQQMFNGCTGLTSTEFTRAFSTWTWRRDENNMQYYDIFNNNNTLANALAGVDLVDANGDHYKRDGAYIKYVRPSDQP